MVSQSGNHFIVPIIVIKIIIKITVIKPHTSNKATLFGSSRLGEKKRLEALILLFCRPATTNLCDHNDHNDHNEHIEHKFGKPRFLSHS